MSTSANVTTRPSWVFLAAAVALGVLFWLIPFMLSPDKSADTLLLFRPDGDPNYVPLVAAAAGLNLGEASVKELAGTGVRSFPLVPFAIHGLFYKLAGAYGFMLADILAMVLYACILRYFLVLAGVAPWPGELLSLLVVGRVAAEAAARLSGRLHAGKVIRYWDTRYPRPFITEIFVVGFWILAMILMAQPRKGKGVYALLGLALALLLQSDIYTAFVAGIVLAGVCAMAAAELGIGPMVARVAAMGVAFAVAAAPMAYQQLHTSLDIKRRWGVFSTTDYRLLLLPPAGFAAGLLALGAACIFAWRFRRRDADHRRRAALAVLGIAIAASLVAGPLSMMLLRQGIQPFHYDETAARAVGYAVLLYAGWLLTDVGGAAPIRNLGQAPRAVLAAVVTVVTIGVCLYWQARVVARQSYTPESKHFASIIEPLNRWDYQTDFPALKRVLDARGPEKGQVLGTFDILLNDWWENHGGYLYLPDIYNSSVDDGVLEARLFEFLHKVGTTPEDFERLAADRYFTSYMVGFAKYQVSYVYVPWPREEYSAGTLRELEAAPLASRWVTFEIPRSERQRLRRGFDESSWSAGSGNALDVIVFTKDHLRPYVHPERMRDLRLVWENRTFEVWEPATAAGR